MRRLNRREALRRTAYLTMAAGLPLGFTAATGMPGAAWAEVAAAPVSGPGYGTDPDLIHPSVPWPNTLTDTQRHLLALLADHLLPEEGGSPAASAVGVVDVVDEWVSAPYPEQARHRQLMLAGLEWMDAEAQARWRQPFSAIDGRQQLQIIDGIAWPERAVPEALAMPVLFFSLLRQLVVGAYYTSPEGVAELGYVGNVPIAGDYPGPTPEAMKHLRAQLAALGLEEVHV